MSRESTYTKTSSTAPVHILWIGPPADRLTGVIHGQDVMGVVEIPSDISVNFWCLDEHCEHYSKRLASHSNVHVRGVKDYLNECLTRGDETDKHLSSQIIPLTEILLDPDTRNSVRDRVTVKVLLQYYIAYQLSGYFMDSNITPLPGNSPKFEHSTQVRFPKHRAVVSRSSDIDMWMIYSPTKHARMLSTVTLYIEKSPSERYGQWTQTRNSSVSF